MIEIVAVEDNRMLIDGLRAWAGALPDIRLAAVAFTVGELLRAGSGPADVVLLSTALRAEPDPALNVRELIAAGHRVVVIDGTSELSMVAACLAAGADGYLTRDHDMAALTATVRAVAAGGTAWSLGPTPAAEPGGRPGRPHLSAREHGVLVAYASGLTLDAAARQLGISPGTARTYLKRIKAKYHQAGLPVHTKLDLADQVRADCAAGACQIIPGIRA